MKQFRGWLLDIYAHPKHGKTCLWVIGEDGSRQCFFHTLPGVFYMSGLPSSLERAENFLYRRYASYVRVTAEHTQQTIHPHQHPILAVHSPNLLIQRRMFRSLEKQFPMLEYFNTDLMSSYKPFLGLLLPGSRILDAGCGSGRDSLFFKKLGYQVSAFDASEEMVSFASKFAGVKVHHLSFHEIEFSNEFEAIWANASLLHVPKNDLHDVITRLGNSLKLNGFFNFSFKYGKSDIFKNGRLYSYYNEKTFAELISPHSEFRLETLWVTNDVRPDREDEKWLDCILRKC
ncbi:MAG: class I SAM-dependent methyltransferase [Anaerolineaceae bacterium]|nr:class I SAM-dependent methyltransferase [Anaerolineaceae bacterium]